MSTPDLKEPTTSGGAAPEPPEKTSRMKVLLRRKTTLLFALALLLLAAAIVVGSSALFSTSSANPSNTFSSGTLSQSNSKEGTAILSATKMIPGDTKNGTVEITNTGDVSGKFSLSSSNLSDTPGPNGGKLSQRLKLKIEDVTNASSPTTIYDGSFDSMPVQQLGTWGAGDKHTYKFAVTFPDTGTPSSPTTGDNAYQGSSTKLDFNWSATSS
jgi:hypothetical protein